MQNAPHPLTLTANQEDAVDAAKARQLELFHDAIDRDLVSTMQECRDLVQRWQVDETLILDLDLDERLQLVEDYADEYGLELGDVTLTGLRDRIDHLAASIVSLLGEQRTLELVDALEALLRKYRLDLKQVKTTSSYGMFRHYDERDEPPWYVYEYRNLEGEGLHVDLFEYTSGHLRFYVEHWLRKGSLTAEEESWDAS